MTKEQKYLLYRKIIAFRDSLVYVIMRVLPVKNNRITVCTFEGKGGFGCNPKYIVEELHRRDSKYEFIWLVNDDTKEFPDYVKVIKNTLWRRTYYLSTSKIWIDNYRKPYGTKKRKKQYYINTWHANIGFKSIGLWRESKFSKMAYLVSKNDSEMIDYVVIDSEFCRQMFPKGLVYKGEFLYFGQPRCDALYGDRTNKKNKFKQIHNIPLDSKIVMYAPTFRETSDNGKRGIYAQKFSIDFARLIANLHSRFGGEWYLCLRLHPQLASNIKIDISLYDNINIIDASNEDDMYEILAAMDVFITDYSSAAMDAGYCKMPVFIYADDIDKYIKDRGSLLWNIYGDSKLMLTNNKSITPQIDATLPYSIAHNNDELEENILSFDEEQYKIKTDKFENDVGLIFDGNASKKVADKIIKIIRG